MGPLIYKWDPSFVNEDIYVSFGTNGTPYVWTVVMNWCWYQYQYQP